MRLNPTKTSLGVLAPLVTALSAWLTASVAKYGVHVDPSGVNAALVAGATCGIAVMVKLIHDVEEDPKIKAVSADADVVASAVEQADPQIRQAVRHALEDEILNLTRRITPTAGTASAGDTEAVTVSAEALLALDGEDAATQHPVEPHPPVAHPPAAEPPAEQSPPLEQPLSAEHSPVVEEPPVAEHTPAVEPYPPVAQPPAAEPPVEQPPLDVPPAVEYHLAPPPTAESQPYVAPSPPSEPPAAEPPAQEEQFAEQRQRVPQPLMSTTKIPPLG
jgi:hypothetical protein